MHRGRLLLLAGRPDVAAHLNELLSHSNLTSRMLSRATKEVAYIQNTCIMYIYYIHFVLASYINLVMCFEWLPKQITSNIYEHHGRAIP